MPMSPFAVHVADVVGVRTDPQVLNVAARRHVARVHDLGALRYRAAQRFIGNAMAQHQPSGSTANAYHTVPLVVPVAREHKAIAIRNELGRNQHTVGFQRGLYDVTFNVSSHITMCAALRELAATACAWLWRWSLKARIVSMNESRRLALDIAAPLVSDLRRRCWLTATARAEHPQFYHRFEPAAEFLTWLRKRKSERAA
jgi:hypothetical protein